MNTNPLKDLGTALGVGLIAGLAGTVAITISQKIEMKITERKSSDAPTKAVAKVLDVKPVSASKKAKVARQIHWTYGSIWGAARGLVSLTGATGVPAALAHFASIWGTGLVMLPRLNLAPPVQDQEPETIAVDMLHHAVYAATAGLVFEAIMDK